MHPAPPSHASRLQRVTVMIMFLMCMCWVIGTITTAHNARRDRQTREHLFTIRLALEDYRLAYDRYPNSWDELLEYERSLSGSATFAAAAAPVLFTPFAPDTNVEHGAGEIIVQRPLLRSPHDPAYRVFAFDHRGRLLTQPIDDQYHETEQALMK